MNETEKKLDQLDSAANALVLELDSARAIANEMSEDFFERFDLDSAQDKERILYAFTRNRAKHYALSTLLCEMKQELQKVGYTR